MTNPPTSTAAVAASEHMQSIDIAKVLRSTGPVVSAVVLRCSSKQEDIDTKPSADALLPDLVDQVQIDTTPKKSEVEQLLGGPFTFVGQYEEEGIMLMARRGQIFAVDEDNDTVATELPRNPHKLQPPFTDIRVYGDIVCLKVAEVEDPLDDDGNSNASATVEVTSNDEFFLNYTKEEYLKFAARTDVVAPVPPEHSEEDEIVPSDDEEEDAGEWSGEEDDDEDEDEPTEEEAQGAMMQLVLGTVLKQFQEQNGREPDEQELAVLKLTVAHKLGAMMGTIQEGDEEEEDEEDAQSVQDESSASASTAVASPETTTESSPESSMKRKVEKPAAIAGVGEDPVAKKLKVDGSADKDKAKLAGSDQ